MARFGKKFYLDCLRDLLDRRQTSLANYRHIAIIGDAPFTRTQQKRIKDAIVATVNARKSNVPPEFSGIWPEDGILIANVADDESEKWLINFQNIIAEQSGCKLRIMRASEIDYLYTFDAVFHYSDQYTNDEILYALESQAREFALSTREWQVVKRYHKGRSVTLTLDIDSNSSVYIQEKNFVLPYRLGHARFFYDGEDDLPTTRFTPMTPATVVPVAVDVENKPPVSINPNPATHAYPKTNMKPPTPSTPETVTVAMNVENNQPSTGPTPPTPEPVAMIVKNNSPVTVSPNAATQTDPQANMLPNSVISCPNNIKRQHEAENLPGSSGSENGAKKLKTEMGAN